MNNRLSLNEHLARRPDFVGGLPIVLANAEEWFIPRLRCRAHLRPWICIEHRVEGQIDPETALALFSAITSCPDPDGPAAGWYVYLAAAVVLLQRNYMLDTEQASWLLMSGFHESNDREGALRVIETIGAEIIRPFLADGASNDIVLAPQ